MSPSYSRPTDATLALCLRAIAPWQKLANPYFEGLDRIPASGPLLFVGNHTLFGVIDVPLFFAKLYVDKGIYMRSLGDHAHFKVPGWGALLRAFGAVDGTRENCAQLMRERESILVFPGGAREVTKRKGEKYQLLWSNRIGFARMAIEHQCTIVPFSSLGAEELFDIVLDGDDFLASPLGRLARRVGLRDDLLFPIVTPPRPPERFYFHIGEPISPHEYLHRHDDEHACRELRERTRLAIERGISQLARLREQDPERYLRDRLKRRWPKWARHFEGALGLGGRGGRGLP